MDIEEPSFYSICYSDREIMKFFIQKSVFSQGSYMDNDFGRIILVEEFRQRRNFRFYSLKISHFYEIQ